MVPGNLILEQALTPTGAEAGQAVALSAAVKLVYAPTRPIAILRWGLIITTSMVNTATVHQSRLNWHPTAGSASSGVAGSTATISGATGWNASTGPTFYTDTAGGTLTTTANATYAAGSGVFHNINPQAKMPPNDASANPVPSPDTAFVAGGGVATMGLMVYPGQEISFEVVTAAGSAAGSGIPFIHFYPLSFVAAGNNYGQVATGVPSNIRPTPSESGTFVGLPA